MREGEYEYIHEFKERIDEILWLQKNHHDIIDNNPNPTIQQTSLAELHWLNITLSNYFDLAPDIIGPSIPAPSEQKQRNQKIESSFNFTDLNGKRFGYGINKSILG
jgi:hypothetical protein